MSQAQIPKLTLEITPPGQRAFIRVVQSERTIIGRDAGDVQLADAEASALHAELDCSGGHVIVRDLGSSNGTWREGKRLPQFALYEGQTFYCGKTAIRLVLIAGDFPVARAGQTSVGVEVEGASPTLTRGTPEREPTPEPDPISSTLVGGPLLPVPPHTFEPPPGWSVPARPPSDAPPEEIWPPTPSSTKIAGWAPPPGTANVLEPKSEPTPRESNRITDLEIPPLGEPAPLSKDGDTGTYPPIPPTRIDVPAPSTISTATPPSSTSTVPAQASAGDTVVALQDDAPLRPPLGTQPPEPSTRTTPASEAGATAETTVQSTAQSAVESTAKSAVESAAKHAPAQRRGPVANAVIKDPAALRGGGAQTGATRVAAGRSWGRLIAIAGITTVIVAGLGAGAYLIYTLIASRSLAFTEEIAEALPDDTIAMMAAASPQAVIDLLGDAVPSSTRAETNEAAGFDVFDADAWSELGVDPSAPVGLALLSIEPPVLALSLGVNDRETLWGASSKLAAKHTGADENTVATRRSFGDTEGWWLAEPTPAAGVFVGDRLTIIWSPSRPDPELIEAKAKAIVAAAEGENLAARPGFDGLVPPPGKTVSTVFVDSGSLSAGLPGSALTTMAVRMALADIDGFAASLSYDDKDIELGLQTIVREGARHLEAADTKGRRQRGIDRLPAPVLASLDGTFNPSAIDRSLSGIASVAGGSLSLIETEFAAAVGVDLRSDVMQNLNGDFGWALVHLPTAHGKADFAAVGWVGVLDEAKAEATLRTAAAKLSTGAQTINTEVVEGTNVFVPQDVPLEVRVFAAEGAVWLALGDVDVKALIVGPDAPFFAKPRHEKIEYAVRKGGLAAGFVDIKGTLENAAPLFSSREQEGLDKATSLLDPLEVLSLRMNLKGRTFVTRLTLHTQVADALPTLLQAAIRLAGDDVTNSVAQAARAERCSALAEHVVGLTRKALEDAGANLDAAWEIERRVLEECEGPKMTTARLDCYFAAESIAGLQVCDTKHPTPRGGDSGGVPADSGDTPQTAVEPIPVPYVDDIWPHLGDDPDSEKPQPEVNYAVPLGKDAQSRGPDDALVTIIEFGDFECPYCQRVTGTIDEVLAAHGKDVRFVFRHNPLERIHSNARLAARATIAAAAQGKFWDMHDKLFENQSQLGEAQLRKMAEAVGLDMVRFDRDFYDAATDRHVQRDIDAAQKFGATGTPSFFINGRFLGGAQTRAAFDAVIAEETARALKFVERRGSTRVRLYEDMLSHFAPEVLKPGVAVAPLDPDEERYILSTTDLPQKGASGFARVQIIECGDFDCPFCARVQKTIDKVLDAYPSQVSFFFAHDPLSFHAGAEAAARAAVAAQNQDKFWEMHDALFEDQSGSPRVEADFVRYAKKIGLDVPKFTADFAASKTAELVETQRKACVDNEGNATPTFFINGRRVTGALELSRFKALIAEELAAGI